MKDEKKTKKQLISELAALRQRAAALEKVETERKQAEDALRESKELFEKTFISQRDAIFLLDAETPPTIIDCNPRATEIFGYTRQEMLGRTTVFLHVDEAALKEFQERLYSAIEERGFLHLPDFRMKRKDGTVFSTEHSVVPLEDEKGQRLGWVSVVRDITERKRAEEALRESERKNRSLIQAMPDLMFRVRRDGTFLDFPTGDDSTLAVPRSAFKGKTVHDLFPKDLADQALEATERALERGDLQVIRYQMPIPLGTGNLRHFEARIVPCGPDEVLAIARDITERKRTEEVLRESEHDKALILNTVSELVTYQDNELRIMWANRAAVESVGLSAGELVGRHCYEIWQQRSEPCIGCPVVAALETGEPHEAEMTTPDGKVWSIRGYPVRDENGRVTGAVEAALEITERKQAEEALRKSEERYKKQFEGVMDAILIADAETGIIIDCNRVASELVGREKSELVGKHQRILHPPEEIEGEFSRTFKQHLKEKEGQVLETQVITKKGEIKDVAIKASIFELEGQKMILGIFRDITERKRAEEALAEERNLLHALMDNIPETIYFKDTASRFTRINKAQADWFGLSDPAQAEGKTDLDFFTKEHAQQAYEDEQEIIRTGEPLLNIEERETWPDLPDTWVLTSKMPLRDAEGNMIGTFGISRDITERKQADEALRKSEERYKKQFEEAMDAIFIADAETGIIIDCNRVASELVGREKSELVGKHQQILHPPEEIEGEFSRTFKQHLKEKEGQVLETQAITKKGEIKDVAIKASVFELEGQKMVLGIFRDITERKRMEKALRESEENFKAVAENANEGILVAVGEAAHVYVNKRAAEITGYSVAELLETDMKGLVHPDEFKKIMERYRKRLAGKPVPTHYETIFIRKDGKSVPVEFAAAKTVWQGQPASVVFFQDITERKQAEEALQQSEARFRELFDEAPVGYHELDTKGRITRVNRTELDMLGYTAEEMLGRPVWEFMVEKKTSRQAFAAKLSGAMPPGRAFERTYRRKDGTTFPVLIEDHHLRDESGQIIGLRSTIQDITELKQVEDALRAEKALMDALMDNIPDSIYFKDRQCRLTRINRNMMRTLDLEEMSQALGKTDLDLYGEEFGRKTLVEDQRILTTGKPIIGLVESRRLENGQINWTSTTKIPLRDASGQIVGLVGVTREINEVKQAEEEAHKRLREITALHRVSEVINATLDLKEVFQRVVEELSSTFGYRLVGIYLVEGEGLRLQAQIGYDRETAPDFIPLEWGVVGRVARTGQPALIRDVTQDPDYVASHPDITCEICVPVMSGGTTLGTLNVESNDKRTLTDHDLQLLSILGSHIGVAIENARLYERSQSDFANLSRLFEASSRIGSTLDLSDTLQFITQAAVAATDGHSATITLTRPEGKAEIRTSVHRTGELRKATEPRTDGVTAKVVQTGEAVIIPNIPEAKEWVNPEIIKAGFGAAACLPLRTATTTLGAMWVNWTQPRHFPKREVELLQTFANQAAIAIENAHLYDETQRHLKEMTTLQRIGMEITSSLDPSNLLQGIADSTLELTNADYVHLFALDPDTGEFNQRAASWQPEAQEPPITWPRKNKGLTAAVLKAQEPVIIEKATDHPLYAAPKSRKWNVESVAGFPLKGKWGVTGVLNLVFLQPHTFSEDELDLLALLADQAAIAIENARLYDETQRHLKEMTTLQRIGMELTSSLDLSSLLQCIADSTLELTNADYLHLFALDPDTGEFNQRAASWQPEAQEPPITWPRKHKGLTAAVLKAQEPVIIEKASDHPIYSSPEARKWGVKSVAGFPLKGKWGVTGVLNLAFLQPHTFSQDERDVLALLADQAAITIENARLYEKTQKLAVTDGLTGLYNLRYFYETLEKEIPRSERYHRPLSLIILDIDDFKSYNDHYGHLAGDDLLKELAQLMSKVTRQTDTLARYGGEEFAIILPETETEQAILLAQRLLKEVGEHRFAIQDGQTIGQITISLGIATYPQHADSGKALVDAADKAMLQAKRAGKNQIAVLREALTELEPL